MMNYLLYYPAELLALLTTLALLVRIPVRTRFAWAVVALNVVALVVRTLSSEGWDFKSVPPGPEGWDFRIFWDSGRALWAGQDPYAPSKTPPLNPPTALPLFALFALVPAKLSLALWTALNVVGCILLASFAWSVLRAREADDKLELPAAALAALTAVVAFSAVARFGLDAGQLGLFTAYTILAALLAQARGRPLLAGSFLALATVKVATLLPFLLLFLRRSDRSTWISLAVCSLGLCLLATPPGELIARCQTCLKNIERLAQPGHVNDYAYENSVSNDMVAVDHLCYRLGFRNRSLIRRCQFLILALLGAWVTWRVFGPNPISPAAACSVVALYSMLFLYHRYYDMVILVLPLLYATARALAESGRRRWLYVLGVCAILALFSVRRYPLEYVTSLAQVGDVRGRILGALVLPFGSWCVLIGLFALLTAERAVCAAKRKL